VKIKNIRTVLFVGFAILLNACQPKVEVIDTNKPNIIFLMDDQHRWDALGVVNKEVITPNLDKLAKEGVHFTQAVCQAPMCVASRYSMMLGLYPNQIGILRNEPGLPDDKLPNLTLPQALKDAGYETAGFGKTHWSVQCSTRGFETRYIGECFEEGANMMIDIDPEGKKEYDTETKNYGGGEEGNLGYLGETSSVKEENHRDGWVFNRCLEYIKGRNDERPLFLYLSFLKPHAGHNVPFGFEKPYEGKTITPATQPEWESELSPHAKGLNTGRKDNEPYAEFWAKATQKQWQDMTMRYYANCTWIDDMFGRILNELEKKGLLENAIIVYVTDHGEMLGDRYYRFNKYCLYESSVRVPIIFAGSALPEEFQGKTDKRPAELVDIYPSILQVAGVNVSDELPGINLLSEETRVANFCALHERKDEAAFMWRTEKYKLILQFNRKENAGEYDMSDIIGGEFYDLTAAQNYHIFLPAKDKDWAMPWGNYPWIKEFPYANYAYDYNFKHGEKGRLQMEFYVTVYDFASFSGPQESIESNLKENELIGISYSMLDFDGESCESFMNLSHDIEMIRNASYLCKFRLSPLENVYQSTIKADWKCTYDSKEKWKVHFEDRSLGGIPKWHWDFGDGNTSEEQNPVHTYTQKGVWTIVLTVEGEEGTSSRSKVWEVVTELKE